MKNVSENILKLRELNQRLTSESHPNNEYVKIVEEIKELIDSNKIEINDTSSNISKIKCYESMCSKIILILNQIKII
jgi:Fic family protein